PFCLQACAEALQEPEGAERLKVRFAALRLLRALGGFFTLVPLDAASPIVEQLHAILPLLIVHSCHTDAATRRVYSEALAAVEPLLRVKTWLTDCDAISDVGCNEHTTQLQAAVAALEAGHKARLEAYVDGTAMQLAASKEAHVRACAALFTGLLLDALPEERIEAHLRAASNLIAALRDPDPRVRALAARAAGAAKLTGARP
ncbi:hypothetical protein AB1Y20_011909, partial [Prymnesium parvum]